MPYRLIIFLILMLNMTLHAQHPFAWQLTEADGLPSLEVYDLFQDSKGYMWIGTNKGLCKYNGHDFYYYDNKNKKGEALSGIHEDNQGRIWVRNFHNQIFYVERDSLHYFRELEDINALVISDYLIDQKGDLWVAGTGNDSLYCYQQKLKKWKHWELFPGSIGASGNPISVWSLKAIRKNEITCLTTNGIIVVKDYNLSSFGEGATVSENLTFIPSVFVETDDNQLLLHQFRKGRYNILKWNESKFETIESFPNKNYFKSKRPHTIRCLSNNSIWQLSLDGGLGLIMNFDDKIGLDSSLILFPKEGISDVVLDHEGNYWVSSLKNGVYIIPQMSLDIYTKGNSVFEQDRFGIIAKGNNNDLLISTDNSKILSYNTSTKKIGHTYEVPSGPCNHISVSPGSKKIVIDGANFEWVFNEKGNKPIINNPLLVNMKQTQIYKDSFLVHATGSPGVRISGIGKNGAGDLKFASNFFSYFDSTINLRSNKGNQIYVKKSKTIRCNWILLDEPNDRFLAARIDSLTCYPEEAKSFAILDENGLIIQAIKIVQTSDEIIWVSAISQGIYGLDNDLKVKFHYKEEDGLIDNYVLEMKADGKNLWLMTSNGLQWWNPTTKESRLYTVKDGLPTLDVKGMEIVNDKVWLSTTYGLCSFDKNMVSKNDICPPIFIKKIAIHEQDTILHPSYILDYTQNGIAIYVEGISYRSRGNFNYKYRMSGIDSIWKSQSSSTNFMRFPQLNPGTYTFEVLAVNEDGLQSEAAAKVQFIITPPYWQTWWFRLGIFLLFGLVIMAIVWNQIRTQRLRNRVSRLHLQALQSQMNPHFIFNVLTAVQNLWLQNKNEAALALQSDFAKLLRKIFQYSSKLAISIEQVEDFLNNYLNLEQIRFENQVSITFEIDDELLDDDYFVPPLLIQPIVENSFKHGLFHKKDNKNLLIVLKEEEPYLYCMIEDNGVGRKKKPVGTPNRSSGLSTTKERLVILQKSILKESHPYNNLKITDLKDQNQDPIGTRVELWVPFVKKQ
jgi:ligand-binding sensor domain-containing protein